MRILIIEDDVDLAEIYKENLSDEGYAADTALTGEEGETLTETIPYDLIILDVALPGKNGLEVCRSLRQKKINIPIIMLSGKMKEDWNVVQGLDEGADDYLIKPVRYEVLSARIRALLRKQFETKNPTMQIRNITIDTAHRQVLKGNQDIFLTLKEYAIFEYLAYHPNVVITRNELELHAWSIKLDAESNVVDQHIKNIRKKLGDRKLIETIIGMGYRLNA